MLFPISGIEVNPLIPFIVALVVSLFYVNGRCVWSLHIAPFSSQYPGIYGTLSQRDQSGFQRRSDTQRGLPVYTGRENALAVDIGGDHWNVARGIHRYLGTY